MNSLLENMLPLGREYEIIDTMLYRKEQHEYVPTSHFRVTLEDLVTDGGSELCDTELFYSLIDGIKGNELLSLQVNQSLGFSYRDEKRACLIVRVL